MLEPLLDLLFPPHDECVVCEGTKGLYQGLCADCLVTFLEPPGVRCGLCLRPRTGQACVCSSEPPPWHGAVAAAAYQGPLREAIYRLKYRGMTYLAKPLGHAIAQAAAWGWAGGAAVLVPVPSAWWRFVRRGYNHAELLAAEVGRWLRLPVEPRWLRRRHQRGSQARLGRAERLANLAGAFSASPAVAGQRICLVDDVLTTGATAQAATVALLEGGAARVDLFVLAVSDKRNR